MKIYFIYKKYENLYPSLYAITDDKDIKDEFMSQRKESMFSCIKKEIDKSEFNKLKDYNYKYFLDRRRFYNESSSILDLDKEYIEIVATYNEEMSTFISQDKVILELGKYISPVSKTFNSEILKALDTLGYFQVYKFINKKDSFVECVEYNYIEDFKLDINHLSVFLLLYGNTFKDKII